MKLHIVSWNWTSFEKLKVDSFKNMMQKLWKILYSNFQIIYTTFIFTDIKIHGRNLFVHLKQTFIEKNSSDFNWYKMHMRHFKKSFITHKILKKNFFSHPFYIFISCVLNIFHNTHAVPLNLKMIFKNTSLTIFFAINGIIFLSIRFYYNQLK